MLILSLKRFLLIATLLCTLTVSLVATSGTTYAQSTNHQTAHAQQSAMHPAKASMGIKSYWNGTLITLNIGEMRVLAAGGYAATFLISVLTGFGVVLAVGRYGTALEAWNAANAYVHNQCYWFWVSTYKPDWGTYACH